jgi:hypothetical protein
MKKIYKSLIMLALLSNLFACNRFERISSVRIVSLNFTDDSLGVIATGEVIDRQGGIITDHGFCFSSINANPKIGDLDSDTLSLGNLLDETKAFSDSIKKLPPDTRYFVRSFMNLDGQLVYGDVKTFQTRLIRKQDVALAIENITVTPDIMGTGKVIVRGFINKLKIEEDSVTIVRYGTIVSYVATDSTNGRQESTFLNPIFTDFNYEYLVSSIPNPPTNPEYYFVWAFVEVSFNSNAANKRLFYTKPKQVKIL